MVTGKKGWIRVVETFIAILLIGAVLLMVVNQNNGEEDISLKIYRDELMIMRAVQLDNGLRSIILNLNDLNLPLSMSDSLFPTDVKAMIVEKAPSYLLCDAKICKIDTECILENDALSEVYTSNVIIFANLEKFNPRKLVLSCILLN